MYSLDIFFISFGPIVFLFTNKIMLGPSLSEVIRRTIHFRKNAILSG